MPLRNEPAPACRPCRTRDGRPWSPAIAGRMARSSIRSGPPASTAGRRAARASRARERAVPCDARGGGTRRASGRAGAASRTSLRSPSGRPRSSRAPAGSSKTAEATPRLADAREGRRAEPPSLSPRVQGRDRPDAARLRRGPSGPARPRRDSGGATVTEAIYDAGFNSSGRFYADVRPGAGHDADRLPRRRRRRGDPLRHRRVLARRDPGRREREGRVRDPAGRRSRRAGARPPGPLPARRAGRRRRRASSGWWRRSSASSRRRRSASICRSTCAARRSSSACGRRCARSRPATTASYAEIAARIGAPKSVRAVAQACARQRAGGGDPLPPRGAQRRRAVGLPLGRRAQARAARARGADRMSARDRERRSRPLPAIRRAGSRRSTGRASTRISTRAAAPSSTRCSAPDECRAVAALYDDDERFRSRVVMARHGFGRGEYKYFAYPLPRLVAELRAALYPRLAADRQPLERRAWASTCAIPTAHADFLARCHAAGQTRPTPLLLRYGAGRLQLPAPGPLRRARVSAAGGDPAVGARARTSPAASSC